MKEIFYSLIYFYPDNQKNNIHIKYNNKIKEMSKYAC